MLILAYFIYIVKRNCIGFYVQIIGCVFVYCDGFDFFEKKFQKPVYKPFK